MGVHLPTSLPNTAIRTPTARVAARVGAWRCRGSARIARGAEGRYTALAGPPQFGTLAGRREATQIDQRGGNAAFRAPACAMHPGLFLAHQQAHGYADDMNATCRPAVDPEREDAIARHSRARRDIRQVMRCPPIDAHSAAMVVVALASGRRITHVGGDAMFPAYWVINRWRADNPDFDALCVQAVESYAESNVAASIGISDDLDDHPASRSVRVDARLKSARLLNRKFG